ncbi:hypothetical protein GTW25_02750 [Aliihoeflea aestuarii]|uniref:hypothetical protein n=1 Tax=Aliihoeflea aestuarii TaxID=453840 RepID=UPI0020929B98|nr:hypothetical protein [Aliihoeflea aestuarii]MCO6389946.1 hypothetical protein [Aliihoeflea aestuarii]
MRNPDSLLALILQFFAPAAIFLAVLGVVGVGGYFVVATIATFALHFMTAENAVLLGLLAASAVTLLILRALPKPPSENGDFK